MAWITLSESDITARLAYDEYAAIEATGSEGNSTPRITGIIEQVTSLVRGKVAACRDNTLGAAGTIPEELRWAAATIAKHDLRASLSTTGSDEETRLRAREIDEAFNQLNSAASCELRIADDGGDIMGTSDGCYGGDAVMTFYA